MARQLSVARRNARLAADESTIGTSPILKFFSGSQPANCAAANSGTELVSLTLPSDWQANPSAGSAAKTGTAWTGTGLSAAGTGTTAGHYRLYASDGVTCHEQGSIGPRISINTSAATSANGNVLTFASTTGVTVGMNVSGTGVPAGATVVAVTSTTVTISLTSTAGVSSGVSIAFIGDMEMDNTSIAAGQSVTVTGFTITAFGA